MCVIVGAVSTRNIVPVLAQGLHSLTRAREASGAAYDKGVVSLIEVLQADEGLLSVRDAQAQARTESARAAVALFKALGGGWTPPPPPPPLVARQ